MAGHLRFLFWKSIGNQRIEAFWSQLRRSCADWWIQFFKGLVLNGVSNNTDFLQVECFKFAFFPVIQKELENIKDNWNSHRIRKSLQSSNEGRPAGRPDILYFVEESSSEYLFEFNHDDWRLLKEKCCTDERNTFWVCSNEFFELAAIVMEENGLFEANSLEEALLLFQELYQLICKSETFSIRNIHLFPFSSFFHSLHCYIEHKFIVRGLLQWNCLLKDAIMR